MSYNKKYYSNSTKGDKNRYPVSKVFVSECSVELTPSPSRLSVSSLIYNESTISNDTESLVSLMSLQELKEKYDELTEKRKELKTLLDEKIKEAIELNKEEFKLTCKIPSDHKLLDPLDEVCFTKNPLPSCLLNDDDVSDYKNEKKHLLLQMETLTNITKVLSHLPKTERKMRKDLEKKRKEIDTIKERLRELETVHASEVINLKTRSNSVGNLNRISETINESISGYLSNGEINYFKNKVTGEIPSTEPSQRKFKPSERSLIMNSKSNDKNKEARTRNDSNSTICTSPRFRITYSKQSSNGNALSPNSPYINSNFQRFASTRTTIKGHTMLENVESSSNEIKKTNVIEDPYCSNISISSLSSKEDTNGSDISDMQESVIEKNTSEPLANKFIALRQSSTVSCRTHNCRDSMELNHHRLNHTDSNHRGKIQPRHNKLNRKSVSLEDLREESITPNITYLPRKKTNSIPESVFSPIRSQITYHHSIKDVKTNTITKPRQPSIIRKDARINSFDKMS